MRRFVSVDLETTGVDPQQDYIAEVGLAGESPHDGRYFEIAFSLDFPKDAMSEGAAAVNGWGKRQFAPIVTYEWASGYLLEVLKDAYIVGKNPQFDEAFLRVFFQTVGVTPSWHYRMVDVGTLAWGFSVEVENGIIMPQIYEPPNVGEVEQLVGIERETVDGYHTALFDARWNYEVFRHIVPKRED